MNSYDSICPFCNTDELRYECEYPDHQNNIIQIYSCENCGCFIPDYTQQVKDHLAEQTSFHESLWNNDTDDVWIDAKNGMLGMLEKQKYILGLPTEENLIIDIGAGRGNLSAAIKEKGYKLLSCEPSVSLFDKAVKIYSLNHSEFFCMPALEFIDLIKDQKSIPNSIYLWHILEHIPYSEKILKKIMDCIGENKINILIQMPMLRFDYIYPEHYFLATPDWFNYVSKLTGLKLVEFTQSKENYFMSGYFSNNPDLDKVEIKRPFRRLSQFERFSIIKDKWLSKS